MTGAPRSDGKADAAADGAPLPLRVLIAEDSEDDALLLVRQLRRAGF